jgi:hypothetical protein
MKCLRHLCFASVLTFALALSTFAGDIHTGVVSPPPPPPQTTSVMGEMATGVTTINEESTDTSYVDPVTEFTLNFLQDLLSLF